MSGRLKLAAQVLALACVAGLLALLVWKLAHQQHAPKVGSVAPSFTLSRLEGSGEVSLASFRGRPVVLNFWASWCVSCKGEAVVLEHDWRRYQPRGVVFLGVDDKDLASDARTFVAAHGLTFPMLQDGSGGVTSSYGISQLPETYILDREGRIVAHIAGPITASGFFSAFQSALARVSA